MVMVRIYVLWGAQPRIINYYKKQSELHSGLRQ